MITIIKPGLLTTIQDTGRIGFQKYGVIASGAMDQLSLRIANLLVGNRENQAAIEITILGPAIRFDSDALISICGADLAPAINGEAICMNRPIFVKKGAHLNFGPCRNGCRTYLAVAGGFDVPIVMESKSTYLRAKIGGFHGRLLKSGDRIGFLTPSIHAGKIIGELSKKVFAKPFAEAKWTVSRSFFANNSNHLSIRAMTGREFLLFNEESQEKLFRERYLITSYSDRMGYRLQGSGLMLKKQTEMVSEAVSFGTIQVPADGNPIVLLADRQTTGGYPRIAQIATVDLPALAQAKPGDTISFVKISHQEAQLLFLKREQDIKLLKRAIKLRLS
jgi:antagonist of KipI